MVYIISGIAFLVIAVYLLILGVLSTLNVILYLALASFLVSMYLLVEAFRWAYWKDFYYHKLDDSVSKPPPRNLIKGLFRQ